MKEYRRNVATVHAYVQRFVDKSLVLGADDLAQKTKGEMNFLDALAIHTRNPKVCAPLYYIIY
jgi:hypothetical protein